MTNPSQPISAYEIVLSEEQLEDLGRFTALFSQIDAMLFQIIAGASKTNTKSLMALIEGTTSGQRLSMLRRLANDMEDEGIQRKAKSVCAAFGGLTDKRNHLLHGIWGLQWNFEKNTLKPACTYERNRENPIYAKQLPELCKRAAELSLKVAELLSNISPTILKPGEQLPRLLLIGNGPPPPNLRPPKWKPPPSRRSAQPNPGPDSAK
jgi:hypothetical protein